MSVADDPNSRTEALCALAPKLEQLAEKYARRSEGLRLALAAMIDAPAGEWQALLYDAGWYFRQYMRNDKPAGVDMVCQALRIEPLSDLASPETRAGYYYRQLIHCAANRDRAGFDEWCLRLAKVPKVAAAADILRGEYAQIILARRCLHDRNKTLGKVRKLAGQVGMDVTTWFREALDNADCSLSERAKGVLAHWIDWMMTPFHLFPEVSRRPESETTPVATSTPEPSDFATPTLAPNAVAEDTADIPLTHDDAFTWVKCAHGEYTFSPKQSKVVAALLKDWESGGLGVRNAILLANVGDDPSKKVANIFKEHEAWNTLIAPLGKRGITTITLPRKAREK
ncbi:MAG: hypothetical protein K8U57_00085 [Planctomycetes bacterium]|nr:hypothetical protein [Planctomycetota bacterium]